MNATDTNRMVQTLGEGTHKYYVYALCLKNRTPFYIGKGEATRVLDHVREAKDAKAYIDSDATLSEVEKAVKLDALKKKLKMLLKEGEEYKPVIIKWGLTSQEAFMCESALINIWKFVGGSDVLANIANGHASKREECTSADVKTKARTLDCFLAECAIAPRPIEKLSNYKLMFINISHLYDYCLDEDGNANREHIKDSVRGFWKYENKMSQVEYIIALYRSRVVGVFHVARPLRRLAEERDGGFEGFPLFPREVREVDRLMAVAPTLVEAKAQLAKDEYNKLIEHFREESEKREAKGKKRLDPGWEIKKFQRRVYFIVDDNIPDELKAYENCVPTECGSSDFVTKGIIQRKSVVFRGI